MIGSIAVHPIEMAAAYAAVADDGVYHAPSFIDHIVDRSGSTIYVGPSPGKQVVSPQVAAEATVALQAVVQSGTGTGAALYNRPVAGKTGTTNSSVDAWFNGFTPQMESTVWMGNGNAEVPMLDVGGVGEVYGGTFPAHTWHDFMANALANLPAAPFTPPNYALLPAAHYITSASLVAADVLDHNSVAGCPGSTYGYNSYNSYNNGYNTYCTGAQSGNGTTTNGNRSTNQTPANQTPANHDPGQQPPVTQPPVTQPPVTQPPATPPPATTPAKKTRHP